MNSAKLAAARQRFIDARANGRSWQDATALAGLPIKRATAYALEKRFRLFGPAAIPAGRSGHPYKLVGPVRLALETLAHAHPDWPARLLQHAIQDQFDLTLSLCHINRFRISIGVPYQRPKKSPPAKQPAG